MDQPDKSVDGKVPEGESLEAIDTGATFEQNDQGESLETNNSSSVTPEPSHGGVVTPGSRLSPAPKKRNFRTWLTRANLYLLLGIFVFVLAVVIIIVLYVNNKKVSTPPPAATIKAQNLSASALQQLADTNGLQVGDPKQVLNIQSNAVFAGTALIRGDLQVAGSIRTGGSLNLTGVSVSGLGSFNKVQTQTLAVDGNGSFTGQLSAQGSLSVGGGGSFGGPVSTPVLNAGTLALSGNLVLNNQLQVGGNRPGSGGGNALGSGGTTAVSGSDTAGTISINTGGSPSAGCFTTIRFTKSFSSPRVIVTPIGGNAGDLKWYVTRDSGGFSVCTNTGAPASQSFAFDYFVVD